MAKRVIKVASANTAPATKKKTLVIPKDTVIVALQVGNTGEEIALPTKSQIQQAGLEGGFPKVKLYADDPIFDQTDFSTKKVKSVRRKYVGISPRTHRIFGENSYGELALTEDAKVTIDERTSANGNSFINYYFQ